MHQDSGGGGGGQVELLKYQQKSMWLQEYAGRVFFFKKNKDLFKFTLCTEQRTRMSNLTIPSD
jgi:hypothetical protein